MGGASRDHLQTEERKCEKLELRMSDVEIQTAFYHKATRGGSDQKHFY